MHTPLAHYQPLNVLSLLFSKVYYQIQSSQFFKMTCPYINHLDFVNSVFISVMRKMRHSAKKQAAEGGRGCGRHELINRNLWCSLTPANDFERRQDGKPLSFCYIYIFSFGESCFHHSQERLPSALVQKLSCHGQAG